MKKSIQLRFVGTPFPAGGRRGWGYDASISFALASTPAYPARERSKKYRKNYL